MVQGIYNRLKCDRTKTEFYKRYDLGKFPLEPMRSLIAFLLPALLVISCGQIPPIAFPIQPKHTLDNDFGNPNLRLGNPSKATTDPTNADNYLLLKPRYVLSYSKSRSLANWASWQLNKSWMGNAKRQNNFRPDGTLPKGWYRVSTRDYTGSGFDRGHLVNSEERGQSVQTFRRL